MKCLNCGDTESLVLPWKRHGLKRNPLYLNKVFCWQCWYYEVATQHLYDGANKFRLRDKRIADQFRYFNKRAIKRMKEGAGYEELTGHDLMGIILKSDALCALSGQKSRLTFDHIQPLGDGGSHTYENLRAVTEQVNNIENAIHFGFLSPDDPRVFYKR